MPNPLKDYLLRRQLRTPRGLPNLAAWYDASDIGSLVYDGSNRVSLVADKSGNSNVNCLCLDGNSGNCATAPDSAATSITGDIDLRCFWRPTSLASAVTWLSKYNVGAGAFFAQALSDTSLYLRWYDSGGTVRSATFNGSSLTGIKQWVRITLNVTTGAATAYTSPDGTTWTQYGSTSSLGAATSIRDTTDIVVVGATTTSAGTVIGQIYRAQIYNGIAGTLAFDADFSRVAKLATSFTESSANAATVTINTSGATGARICGERDLYQGTVANQPVLLHWAGQNYGWVPGMAGNYFSTPSAAPLNGAGDKEFFFRIKADDYTPAGACEVGQKYNTSTTEKSWGHQILTSGKLYFYWAETGGTTIRSVTSSVAPSFTDRTTYWVRVVLDVDNGSGGHSVTWYTQADTGSNVPPSGGWSQLGTAQNAGAFTTSVHNSTEPFTVAKIAVGAAYYAGGVYYFGFSHSIGGAIAAAFNADDYQSGTTFVASTGETWTLNGGACIATRTGLYFDGSNDYLKAAPFSLSQPETVYFVGSQVSWTINDVLLDGGSASTMRLSQQGTTPSVSFYAGSSFIDIGAAWAVATQACVSVLFQSPNGKGRVNRGAQATGDPGNASASGFTLGARADGSAAGNITASEVAIYAAAHPSGILDRFAKYAMNKWRIAA